MKRALVLLACLAFAPAVGMGAKWYTAESSEFIVIGDARKSQVAEVLEALEVYRYISSRFAILRKPAPYKPRIFVLAPDSFRRFGRQRQNIAGFVQPSDFEMDIVIESRESNDWFSNREIIQHELTHFYLRLNARSTVLPVWYDEGLAEFFSTLSFKGKQARIGEVPVQRYYALQQGSWLPLEKLLSVDRSAPEYRSHNLADAFYAQSWLLVHYSMLKEPALALSLERMINSQSLGIDVPRAMASAFGPRAATLQAELRRYAAGSAWPYRYFERPAETLKVAEMHELDLETAYTEVAELLLRLRNRPPEDLLKDINALLPATRTARAAAVRAMVMLEMDQPANADAELNLCESAAQAGRELRQCAMAWALRAMRAGGAEKTAVQQDRAIALASRALEKTPEDFLALNLLLHVRDQKGEDVTNLLATAEHALEKLPSSFVLRMSLAKAYFDSDRLKDAQRHLERAALDSTEPSERETALDLLRSVENVMAGKEKS